MPVLGPFDRADRLEIGQRCPDVSDPPLEALLRLRSQLFDDPGEVGPVGPEPPWHTRRAGAAHPLGVQDDPLDPLHQDPLYPRRHRKECLVLGQVGQGRLRRAKAKRVCQPEVSAKK